MLWFGLRRSSFIRISDFVIRILPVCVQNESAKQRDPADAHQRGLSFKKRTVLSGCFLIVTNAVPSSLAVGGGSKGWRTGMSALPLPHVAVSLESIATKQL